MKPEPKDSKTGDKRMDNNFILSEKSNPKPKKKIVVKKFRTSSSDKSDSLKAARQKKKESMRKLIKLKYFLENTKLSPAEIYYLSKQIRTSKYFIV